MAPFRTDKENGPHQTWNMTRIVEMLIGAAIITIATTVTTVAVLQERIDNRTAALAIQIDVLNHNSQSIQNQINKLYNDLYVPRYNSKEDI